MSEGKTKRAQGGLHFANRVNSQKGVAVATVVPVHFYCVAKQNEEKQAKVCKGKVTTLIGNGEGRLLQCM